MTDIEPGLDAAPTDGTAAGMMAWFAWMIRTHEVAENTASSLRTGVRNVLAISNDWEEIDVTRVDAEAQLQRFRNAKRGTLSDSSVEEYGRRFRACVDSYKRWLDGEKDWHPSKARNAAPKKPGARLSKPASVSHERAGDAVALQERVGADERPAIVRYVLPLRSGDDAVLLLPRELTVADAKRIGRHVQSLAFDAEEDDDLGAQTPQRMRVLER